LSLGRMVLHRSGDEGIDELWGEPFKAFSFPIEQFYRSRYVKIAQTMRAIDSIGEELARFGTDPPFLGIESLVVEFGRAAKAKTETLRTDRDVFDVWTSFVVAREELVGFAPRLGSAPGVAERERAAAGAVLVRRGADLVTYVARARVPM